MSNERVFLEIDEQPLISLTKVSKEVPCSKGDGSVFDQGVVSSLLNLTGKNRAVVLEGLLQLSLGDVSSQPCQKDGSTIFAVMRSEDDFVFSNFSSFESSQNAVSNLRRGVNDAGFVVFDFDFFSELSFLSEMLLNLMGSTLMVRYRSSWSST